MGGAQILAGLPAVLYPAAALSGLVVGSFLNVVVARLPARIEGIGAGAAAATGAGAPCGSRSRCPACHSLIRWYHNVPLVSFAMLRGRCADCGQAISWRYPLVELGGAVAVAAAVAAFGPGLQAAAASVFLLALLALVAIDIEQLLLPDDLVLPLMWLGLLCSTQGLFTDAPDAILGAAAGYGALWLLYQAHRLVSGKEGMGYGDFKLSAALGAWLGLAAMPGVLLLAFVAGTLAACGAMLLGRGSAAQAMPFGPALAFAGACGILAPEQLAAAFRLLGG